MIIINLKYPEEMLEEEEWEAKEEDVDEFICGAVREINIDK